MFTGALFTIAEDGESPEVLPPNEEMKKMWSTPTRNKIHP